MNNNISKNFQRRFAAPFILEPPFKKLWLRACILSGKIPSPLIMCEGLAM